jgi:hypothetical protein
MQNGYRDELFLRRNRPGLEVDHQAAFSAEVRMCEAIPPFPQYVFMAYTENIFIFMFDDDDTL